MLAGLDDMPSKAAKQLPDDAKEIFFEVYNDDFAWRSAEAHALKAAWRAVRKEFQQEEDGTWVRRAST